MDHRERLRNLSIMNAVLKLQREKSMGHRERLRNHAAAVALKHWRSLLRQVRAGKDLASQHQWRLLAGSERSRARLAREFYSEAHLAKLVALSKKDVVDRMSPWIESAIDSTLEWGSDGLREHEHFLGRMAKSQYVVRVEHHGGYGMTIVDGQPNEEVAYGDLYEMSAAGFSVGGTIYLCKATGEPFTPRDMRATFLGMKDEFYANADDAGDDEDGWNFEWIEVQDNDRVLVVSVDERFADEGDR